MDAVNAKKRAWLADQLSALEAEVEAGKLDGLAEIAGWDEPGPTIFKGMQFDASLWAPFADRLRALDKRRRRIPRVRPPEPTHAVMFFSPAEIHDVDTGEEVRDPALLAACDDRFEETAGKCLVDLQLPGELPEEVTNVAAVTFWNEPKQKLEIAFVCYVVGKPSKQLTRDLHAFIVRLCDGGWGSNTEWTLPRKLRNHVLSHFEPRKTPVIGVLDVPTPRRSGAKAR